MATESEWSDLFNLLIIFCNHTDLEKKEIGFYLLSTLAYTIVGSNANVVNEIVKIINDSLSQSQLQTGLFKEILNSIVFLIIASEPGSVWTSLSTPMAACIKFLPEIIRKDDADGSDCLVSLTDVISYEPNFLKPMINQLGDLCFSIANDNTLEDDIREMGVELLDCLCEAAPQIVRKNKGIIQKIYTMCFLFLSEIDDDENWVNTDGEKEFSNDHTVFAREVIYHCSTYLGLQPTSQIFMTLLKAGLSTNNWKVQYSSLIALSNFVQGCGEDLENEVQQMLAIITPFLTHTNYRLKYAALEVLDIYSSVFSPTLQDISSKYILDLFLEDLNSQIPLKVQSKILFCLEVFCSPEYLEESKFAPYVQPLLVKAVQIMQTPNVTPFIQQQCLGCISAVSTICDFTPFYAEIYKLLYEIISFARGVEYIALRSKAIDCLGIIIESVGMYVFKDDGNSIIKLLLGDNTTISYDDPSCCAILRTCTRITEVIGKQFKPYISKIFPALFQMSLPSLDQEGSEDGDLDAHTEKDEERCEAFQMFRDLANILKDDFYEYLTKVWGSVREGVTFETNDTIRSQCAMSLPVYLDIIIHHQPYDKNDIDIIFQEGLKCLFDQLSVEDNLDTKCCIYQAANEFFEVIAKSGGVEVNGTYKLPLYYPDQEVVIKVTETLLKCIEESMSTRAKLLNPKKKRGKIEYEDDDLDEQEKEDRLSLEDEALYNIEELFGCLIKIYRDGFATVFEQKLLPMFIGYVKIPNAPICYHVCAICLLENAVESFDNCSNYIPMLYELIKSNISRDDSIMKQVCSFAIGIIAIKRPQTIKAELEHIFNILKQTINQCKKKKLTGAKENSVSALGKILQYIEGASTNESMWDCWLNSMPIISDSVEAVINNYYLVKEIKCENKVLLQPKYYEKISYTLCRAYLNIKTADNEIKVLCNDETRNEIPNILKLLFQLSPEIATATLSKFTSEEKRQLSRL